MEYSGTPGITLKMLLDEGLLLPGTKVHAALNNEVTGTLNSDGSITIKINNVDRTFLYPSGAARAIEHRSLNGWTYWTVRELGSYKNLKEFRDKYIAMGLK